MKIIYTILLFTFFGFFTIASAQKLNEPKLVGSWVGGEDFGEFIFHKTEELNYYLNENPKGKIIVRICSNDAMPLALVSSVGFAPNFPFYAKIFNIPLDKVYYSNFSKCLPKREQYWFVPENSYLQYDEIITADKIQFSRFIENYHENYKSTEAKKEFNNNVQSFIAELKKNPQSDGFIILNLKTQKIYSNQVLKLIKKEKIDLKRIRIVKKKQYETYYPEFMTVFTRR